jgi:hypothetical protein
MAISDECILREKARELIQAGALPNRRPDRTWGGPGSGADCSICRAPVGRDEVEFEIEFDRNGDGPGPSNHHVHLRCFAAWEVARLNLGPDPASTAGGGAVGS